MPGSTNLSKFEVRYSEVLKRTESFLKSDEKPLKPKRLSDQKIKFLLSEGAACPLCGTEFEGGNHNTEHIHPRVFGGGNEDSNLVQLCVPCNQERDQVMKALLGHATVVNYRGDYPENWSLVKEFLIWCQITIDDGLEAGEPILAPHERFIAYRFGNPDDKRSVTFGRSSEWWPMELAGGPASEVEPSDTILSEPESTPATKAEFHQGPPGSIRGFSTTAKAGKISLKFPPDPSLLVEMVKIIESKHGEEVSWDEMEQLFESIEGLTKNRIKSTIKHIKNVTYQDYRDLSIFWESVPPLGEEIIDLLWMMSKNRISTSVSYQYLNTETTLENVDAYFEVAMKIHLDPF